MDFWPNLLLFIAIGFPIMLLLNFLLFRFSLIRKLLTVGAGVVLLLWGNFVMADPRYSDPTGPNAALCIFALALSLILACGDTLLDVEEGWDSSISVFEFLGVYYVEVSEERTETPAFVGIYFGANIIACIAHFVCFQWMSWVNFYTIMGIIIIGYTLLLKPVVGFILSRFN